MDKKRQILIPRLALCILGGATFLTLALISPPPPLPADVPATEFSAGRAMQDLEMIAREPHPMGVSPAHAAVRDYLLGEIRELGLEPQVQDTFGIRLVHPGWLVGGTVENILVRLPGTDPEGAILLIAHYDSTPGAPGAADNGAGVATYLEILRALRASRSLVQDVVFLFTDGHEPGIIGTHAFAAQHPWFGEVKCVINLDVITDGPLAVTRTIQDGVLIQGLARSAARPAYLSLPYHLFPSGESDLIPFEQVGVPAANLTRMRQSLEPHTMLDLPEIVSPSSTQQAGNQVLALVRHLGNLPSLTLSIPDQTFFPMLGRLIHYPAKWALPLAILAGLCFSGTLFYGYREGELTWKGLGLGLLALLLSLLLGVLIAVLLWKGIQILHPEYQYSSYRPHLSNDLLYALGFCALVLAVTSAIIALARRRVARLDLAAGALVIWFPGALVVAFLIPASSYLAAWILLAGSLALLLALAVRSRKAGPILSGLGFLISAIVATFLWVPVVYSSYLGSSFPMLWLVIAVAAMWLAAMFPALDWITSPRPWFLPAAASLAALGLLVAGHILVGRNSPPPPVNSIGYWLDAESGTASWVAFIGGSRSDAQKTTQFQAAFPEKMDERQAALLVTPIRRPYTDLSPAAPEFSVLTGAAPPLPFDGPRLEVISDEWAGGRRALDVRFRASMHDRLYIIVPKDFPLVAITAPNNERTELPPLDGKGWVFRFDGMPLEAIEVLFEFSGAGPIQFLLVEEKTGLPTFPGLVTQPEPGTMMSPGEFYQGVPSDFTAIYRSSEAPASGE